MNNLGLHSPCSFCKVPHSKDMFIMRMNKILYKYRMYSYRGSNRMIVPLMDRNELHCKFSMSCNELMNVNSTIQQLSTQYVSYINLFLQSNSPEETKLLSQLLTETSRLYPKTVEATRRQLHMMKKSLL